MIQQPPTTSMKNLTDIANFPTYADRYIEAVLNLATKAYEINRTPISEAAQMVRDAFDADGLLYVFGSGHSHMFAEEAFYRAGGSARVSPILRDEYMLHRSAERSTHLERTTGLGEGLLDDYQLDPERDVLLVVSNSGVNALPVEVASTAVSRNIPVIAITSVQYSKFVEADTRLCEIADVVLDNLCPAGDALLELDSTGIRIGPGSTVVGLALLNSVIVETLALQQSAGYVPDVYLSAGMPDAVHRNSGLAQKFRQRIRHI